MICRISVLVTIACLAGVCGCISGDGYFSRTRTNANVFVDQDSAKIGKVAVVTFKAPTELIGKTVSDLLVTEILRTGEYALVERNELAAVLGETELALAGLTEGRVVAAAQKIGAEGVIFGTVDEYVLEAQKGRTYPVAAISVRMVDCGTGRVLWGASIAEKARSSKTTLPEHGRAVVHQLAAGLYKEWMKYDKPRRTFGSEDIVLSGSVGIEIIDAVEVSDDGLREVRISWGKVPDGASQMRIHRADAKAGPFEHIGQVKAADGSFTDGGRSGLKDSTVYHYSLTPVFRDGMPVSPPVIIAGKTAPPPEPPEELTGAAPEARIVELGWSGTISEGVSEYIIEVMRDGEFAEIGRARECVYRDGEFRKRRLEDSTEYTYRVRSVNVVDSISDASRQVSVITRPPPAPIAGVEMKNSLVRAIELSWVSSMEEDVVGYDIYRSGTEEGPYRKIDSVKGRQNTTYIDGRKEPGNLEDNAGYWYRIVAVNKVGAESEMCAPAKGSTSAPVPVVHDLTAKSGMPRSVLLNWTRPESDKLAGFILRRCKEGEIEYSEICRLGADETEYLDKGGRRVSGLGELEDGTRYEYQIAAFDLGDYFEGWSDSVVAETKQGPEVPQDPALGVNGMTLTWEGGENAGNLSFRIWQKTLFSWKQYAVVEGRESFDLSETAIEERLRLSVSAFDSDGIETERVGDIQVGN